MSRYVKIDSEWRVSYAGRDGKEQHVPASVPGNVLADLVRAGVMPEPYSGDNSLAFRELEYLDFAYETEFASPDFAQGERVELVFNGVDTIADYYLDGEKIGESRNMFIVHRLDITARTSSGKRHSLKVVLRSAVNYARQFDVPAYARAQDYNYETLYLRKARHSFGWDIMPRLVGAGLWREVGIEVHSATEWTSLYLRTIRILPEGALFYLNWQFTTDEKHLDDFSAVLEMKCGSHEYRHEFTPRFVCGKTYFFLPNPQLWWPAGSGPQNLYDAKLTLYFGGRPVAKKTFVTAARTIQLNYKEKARGAAADRFDFIVNDQKIYVRGINHVPVDALHGENAERRIRALEHALELNCNMVRIWGGGVYEDDDFYDWCDRHGMMVWQDFMFACECPPHDEWYLKEVANEAEQIVKKLRNHPSLAIFCGDNECDVTQRGSSPELPPSFNRITRQILPEAVGLHAPECAYIASSPFISDDVWASRGRFAPPEQHPWGDRYDWKSDYYHDSFRCAFASEIGYPGINCLESLKKYMPQEALSTNAVRDNAPLWHIHASAPFNANHPSFSFRMPLLWKHVKRSWGEAADDIATFIEQSQIIHAEAMKTFVETFRVNRSRCGGLMLWNLLDGWPMCSEALLDYYFAKKAAFDYVRRAQQSLCMILPEPTSWRATPIMVNDRPEAAAGNWRIINMEDGKEVASGAYSVAAGSSSELVWFDHAPNAMQLLALEWDDGAATYHNHALLGNAPYDFERYRACMARFKKHLNAEKM